MSHFRLLCLVFFCSALTQTVLICTVGSTECKDHLQLKHSTAEWHIKTTLLCPTYSLQAAELIHGYDNDIVTEHNVESHDTSLTFYGYTNLVTRALRCSYVKIKSHALIALNDTCTHTLKTFVDICTCTSMQNAKAINQLL